MHEVCSLWFVVFEVSKRIIPQGQIKPVAAALTPCAILREIAINRYAAMESRF
jgi:hypothetical protein